MAKSSDYRIIRNHDDFYENNSEEIVEVMLYPEDVARVSAVRDIDSYEVKYSLDSASILLHPKERVSFL